LLSWGWWRGLRLYYTLKLNACQRLIVGWNLEYCQYRHGQGPGQEGGWIRAYPETGEDTLSEAKRTLKQRVFYAMREYLLIAFYLFVVFSLFAIYKSVILAEDHIDFAPQGLALINALALAKVVLVGQELHMANQFQDAPLIYPTLLKSFVYTLVLTCFKIAEGIAVRMFHGRSFQDSIAVFAGGSWKGLLSLTVLLFVVLVPFFGFTELRRVFGGDRLVGAFFRPRHLLNLPPPGA
jgi:hypothetical protein